MLSASISLTTKENNSFSLLSLVCLNHLLHDPRGLAQVIRGWDEVVGGSISSFSRTKKKKKGKKRKKKFTYQKKIKLIT